GYVTAAGECNTGIIIRSALCKDGVAKLRSGAGIVADSTSEGEAQEIQLKAEKLQQLFGGKQ
ncbi:MAG: chorismate-binding protein, partial [Candidatus Woesearchaeota archaeon]